MRNKVYIIPLLIQVLMTLAIKSSILNTSQHKQVLGKGNKVVQSSANCHNTAEINQLTFQYIVL